MVPIKASLTFLTQGVQPRQDWIIRVWSLLWTRSEYHNFTLSNKNCPLSSINLHEKMEELVGLEWTWKIPATSSRTDRLFLDPESKWNISIQLTLFRSFFQHGSNRLGTFGYSVGGEDNKNIIAIRKLPSLYRLPLSFLFWLLTLDILWWAGLWHLRPGNGSPVVAANFSTQHSSIIYAWFSQRLAIESSVCLRDIPAAPLIPLRPASVEAGVPMFRSKTCVF